jgi:hypothetical protein
MAENVKLGAKFEAPNAISTTNIALNLFGIPLPQLKIPQ